MPIRDLKGQIARLPEQPGVYLYSNGQGETLYVGKARVLRDRVRSYLGAYGTSPRIDALLDEAERLEVIVTDSVVEALALENNLIKQRSPKYNILLRDDKTYPYLQLTTGEAYPRVLVARRVERDEHFYAGPFMPAALGRRTMSLTHKLFGIRSCNEVITGERGRPCLEFDIKRCIAPCVSSLCSREEYGVAVEHTRLFLEGRNDELLVTLRERMTEAASSERFEQAAQLRDAIRTIETVRTRQQKMESNELGDRDAFGLKIGPAGAVVQIFQMRGGKVVERIELVTETREPPAAAAQSSDLSECDVLQAALQQFYAERIAAPEVHIPVPFPAADAELLENWLSGEAGRRVRLVVPKRGEKRGLLELASRNAQVAYQARFNENVAANYDALETLRAVLGLPSVPRRIECFDISTIQGSETVASMVVCEDGRMKRSEYRKFRIRGDAVRGSRFAVRGYETDPARAMNAETRESVDTPAPAAAASGESSSCRAAARGGGAPRALSNAVRLLLRSSFQRRDFLCIQVAKFTRPNALVRDWTDPHALQPIDGMTDRFAHVAHLPVPPFFDDDRHDRVIPILRVDDIQELHLGRTRAASVNDNPFREPVQIVLIGHAENLHLVFALDLVTGMRQAGREITVARQQQQPFRLVVEPPNRIYVVAYSTFRQQVDDGRPSLRIGAADDITARFVEKKIKAASGTLEPATIDPNVVGVGIGLRSELGDRLTVYADAPVSDVGLCRTARGNTSGRKDFLKPLTHTLV
jgi:excinuclease ABC subunit C